MKIFKFFAINIILLTVVVLLTETVHACPMCQGNSEGAKNYVKAYKITTLFLTLLPLVSVFFIYKWIKKNNSLK